MPIDFNSHELKSLLRQFEKGNVVLFAGAGFSLGARNPRGSDPPLGTQIAENLASECGWKYEGEDLGIVYDQAQKHLGSDGLNGVVQLIQGLCSSRLALPHSKPVLVSNLHHEYRMTCWRTRTSAVLCSGSFPSLARQTLKLRIFGSSMYTQRIFTALCSTYGRALHSLPPSMRGKLSHRIRSTRPGRRHVRKLRCFVGSRLNEPPM